jgi:small subunit ribosomal protein S21
MTERRDDRRRFNDRNNNNKQPRKERDNQAATVNGNKLEHEPVQAQPLQVEVRGNFDRALRAFRNLVQKERILSTYKEKQSYEKPSVKRRRKQNESKRKRQELDTPRNTRDKERSTRSRNPREDNT